MAIAVGDLGVRVGDRTAEVGLVDGDRRAVGERRLGAQGAGPCRSGAASAVGPVAGDAAGSPDDLAALGGLWRQGRLARRVVAARRDGDAEQDGRGDDDQAARLVRRRGIRRSLAADPRGAAAGPCDPRPGTQPPSGSRSAHQPQCRSAVVRRGRRTPRPRRGRTPATSPRAKRGDGGLERHRPATAARPASAARGAGRAPTARCRRPGATPTPWRPADVSTAASGPRRRRRRPVGR